MLKVIIVEDSGVVRERLTEMLGAEAGIGVIGQYADADTAIDGIRNGRPHAIVLDIRLADSSGMDVLRFVSSQGLTSKVIVLTDYAEPLYRKRYLAAGAFEVLDKTEEFSRLPQLLGKLRADIEKSV